MCNSATTPPVASYFVQATLNAANTGVHLGLVGRYQDVNNGYYVDFAPGGGSLQLRRVLSGTDTVLASASLTGHINTDRVVRFVLVGPVLEVFVDGLLELVAVDGTITAAGG